MVTDLTVKSFHNIYIYQGITLYTKMRRPFEDRGKDWSFRAEARMLGASWNWKKPRKIYL